MRVVLMDRDGTLIADPPDERVEDQTEIKLFPDTISALSLLAEHGYKLIIITNQAAIAEGTLSEPEFWRLQGLILELLRPSGIEILKTYMNSDGVDSNSPMRKPAPGMLLAAAKDYDLDLSQTYMVGDRASDVQAGINAGSKTILVKTGNNPVTATDATYVAKDLIDAARYIAEH